MLALCASDSGGREPLLRSLHLAVDTSTVGRACSPDASNASAAATHQAASSTSSVPLVVGNPCALLWRIRKMPLVGERGRDAAYVALLRTGVSALPCLIDLVPSKTPMADPRSSPHALTTAGDVAFFMIWRISNLSENDVLRILPPEIGVSWHDEGIYSYFRFVDSPGGRSRVQASLRTWYRKTFGGQRGGT